ncbi:MAG: DUF531 family protein [Euryarchaeota archaeon]|nr:DUF531 family protein [Euryarchaeota archaeon]
MKGMRRGRVTIGLYNAYDPHRFREPHRRVIARAGDLALAFDMNLALFGFPVPEDTRTPLEVAQWIADTTSIGDDGRNFLKLAEQGRFHRFEYPAKGFPPQLGEPILTTSKPVPGRGVDLNHVADAVREGRSLLLVFGIGPHGVPKSVASIPKHDFDVTGGGHSLETCTALGAVCGALYARLDQ